MQVGQDDAFFRDHHAGAHTGVLHVAFGVFLVFVLGVHTHHRGRDQLRGTGGPRRQFLGVQGVQHRRVDVVLGQPLGCANLPGQAPSEGGCEQGAQQQSGPKRQALQALGDGDGVGVV